MARSSFEHPMMPREIADAPDIVNVPVADGVHTLSGTVLEMYHEIQRISNHLGITLDRERTDTTELGDRVRDLKSVVHTEESIETLALEVDGTVRYALRAQETARHTAISVYPVGFLMEARDLWHAFRAGRPVYLRQRIKQFRRQWRNRNYWNGFLAEVDYPPEGLTHTMCGRGWTRRAAARSLGYRLWQDNKR